MASNSTPVLTRVTPKRILRTTVVAQRYSIPERIFIASSMEIYNSPSFVRKLFAQRYHKDPPSRLTIRRIHEKFTTTGSVSNNIKGVAGPKVTVRTEKNIRKTETYVRRHKQASTRRIGYSLGISNFSAHKILIEDLNYKPYHFQRVQALKPADKEKRVSACRVLFAMSVVQPEIQDLIIFSDEATFHVSGFVNSKTCIFWGRTKPTEVQEYVRSSPKVNVWCAVSSCGIIGPYFHDENTVNGDRYLKMLDEFFIDNLSYSLRRNSYFQQDGAPCHFTRDVRLFLDQHFPQRWIGRAGPIIWPPYSPDLTSCDFWLWGMLKARVYSKPIKNIRHLKKRITKIIRTIPTEMCRRANHSAFRRFECCIEVNGDQVEKYIH